MATLDRAVKELQSERSRLERELERVNAALSALSSLNGFGRGRGRGRLAKTRTAVRPQRHFSAAARRRMAAAQKARWAKLRQERAKKTA
jgi:hypothetical protein